MFNIVSGAKGSGKSAYLFNLAEEYKTKGIPVGGVISRSLWKNNEKIGYEAVDPFKGEAQLLAVNYSQPNSTNTDIFSWGQWYFRQSCFMNVNARIFDFIKNHSGSEAVLFIDEIGRMELDSKGWNIAGVVKQKPSSLKVVLGVRQDILDRLEPVWGIIPSSLYKL